MFFYLGLRSLFSALFEFPIFTFYVIREQNCDVCHCCHYVKLVAALGNKLVGSLLCLYSMGIESVVDKSNGKSSGILHDASCSACEMAVVWMKNQLGQNQTQDRILNYVNEVK